MSTLKADTIQSTSGGAATLTKQSAAKAWAFYETDSPSSIRSSVNVASLTDNGSGDSTFAFVSSFSSADYTSTSEHGDAGAGDTATFGSNALDGTTPRTSSALRMETFYRTGSNNRTPHDNSASSFVSHGDLA